MKPGFRIRIHLIRILGWLNPIQIQGFDDQKLKKIYSKKNKISFFDQKLKFTYP